MSNTQRKGISLLTLSLIFVAAATLPAFADNDNYARSATPAWNDRATARLHLPRPRFVRHATRPTKPAPTNKAADDLCDLPSTGCESFLAN